MKKEDKPIIVEQSFNTSIDVVWESITELSKMHQWYFENIPAFKPEVGFETQFNVQSGERNFLHIWKVTEVIQKKKLVYNWKFAEYPGNSYVEFELIQQENSTLLRLTVNVLEDFPEDIPEFKRESCIEGWIYFIKDRLKEFLK